MNYTKSEAYDKKLVAEKIMGPNPLKLEEELLANTPVPRGAAVMDLGSGQGLTSVFLAREYGFHVYAVDLWSDPEENRRFFERMGLMGEQIVPVKGDANALPFERAFFDAVVCTDSYNYFGREPGYLGERLLPFVKRGGYIYISVPGMKKDLHDDPPRELLLSWTPEQLDFIHDAAYWRALIEKTPGIDILSIRELEGNEELWRDWLACDNDYARNDRRAMDAGAGQYLNFIGIVLKKR